MADGNKKDSSSQGNHQKKSTPPASSHDKNAKEQGAKNGIPLWLGIVVAFLAIILGLVTPPLLKREPPLPNPTLLSKIDDDAAAAAEQRTLQEAAAGEPSNEVVDGTAQQLADPCSSDRLKDFWHDEAAPGFHILCFHVEKEDEDEAEPKLVVTMYKNGLKEMQQQIELPFFTTTWPQLRDTLAQKLTLPTTVDHNKQPWAIFSPQGLRLLDESSDELNPGDFVKSLVDDSYGMALLYEGGQFVWPAVRIGFKRSVDLYSIMPDGSPDMSGKNQTITLETLSVTPLVFSVTGFLTAEECKHVQQAAEPTMRYSDVVLMDKDQGRPASDFRTSQTTFVAAKDDILIDIDYRTASLVRVPRNHQEHTQVLRYGLGEKYVSHHDFFNPSLYQDDANTLRLIQNGRRNRMSTVFWYLSDVPSGGETVFPRFNNNVEKSMSDCETGLKVKPEAGKVIIFYSMTADGRTDVNSLHGACPVHEGIKWAANKWVWNEPMGYTPP